MRTKASGSEAETSNAAVVRAWHSAVNAGDLERLDAVVAEDVEVVGPRGGGRGVDLMHDWIERAGIQLEPTRFTQRGDAVVVEQWARWRSLETNELSERQIVASVFELTRGRISRISRYDDLATALAAAGLSDVEMRDI